MIGLLPTGSVTGHPHFTDHRRIRPHIPDVGLELSIYRTWDERVVDDLAGLPVVTAHAEKTIGATLSGDEPAFDRFALSCRIAAGLGAGLLVFHLWELPDGDRYLERNLGFLDGLSHDGTVTLEFSAVTDGGAVDHDRLTRGVEWLRNRETRTK